VEGGVAVPWCVCVCVCVWRERERERERERGIASLVERLERIIGSNACCVIAGEVGGARCGQRISIGKKHDAYPIYAHDVSLMHIYFVCKVHHASYMCVLECAQCTRSMCTLNVHVEFICAMYMHTLMGGM
jgi:hypothetical protein